MSNFKAKEMSLSVTTFQNDNLKLKIDQIYNEF